MVYMEEGQLRSIARHLEEAVHSYETEYERQEAQYRFGRAKVAQVKARECERLRLLILAAIENQAD